MLSAAAKKEFLNLAVLVPLAILLVVFCVSCKHKEQGAIKGITDEVQRSISQAKTGIAEITPKISSMTTDEIAKLNNFEYRVVDLKGDPSELQISTTLNQLGQDRWECFAVLPIQEGQRLFLKRRPDTYLRYFPLLSAIR